MRSFLILMVLVLLAAPEVLGEENDFPSPPKENPWKNAEDMIFFKGDFVTAPQRRPVLRSRAPENVTVLTAKQIEEMHAHSLAEVLERVPGLWVSWSKDIGATSLLAIQGSEQRHVLVLLDGVPMNFFGEGHAEINSIPVGIINQIEIIKGPASSAWGSSLGGVVAIYTKKPGYATSPEGSVSASIGERDTRRFSAEVKGRQENGGLYLFAEDKRSDGLLSSRGFDGQYVFGKATYQTSPANFHLSLGFSNPDHDLGDFEANDLSSSYDNENYFFRSGANFRLWRRAMAKVMIYATKQDYNLTSTTLSDGSFYKRDNPTEKAYGGSVELSMNSGGVSQVLGFDYRKVDLENAAKNGTFIQSLGAPPSSNQHATSDEIAAYYNATFYLDRLTVIPGIRFSNDKITGAFIAPSLGCTYRFFDHSVLRMMVSRGFSEPSLASSRIGGLLLDPNPDLDREEIWSYQAGLETAFPRWKALINLFYHDVDNSITLIRGGGSTPGNRIFINQGSVTRQGVELSIETVPWNGLSLYGDIAYTDISPKNNNEADNPISGNIAVTFNSDKGLRVELAGHYEDWDSGDSFQAQSGFTWDLTASQTTKLGAKKTEFFCKIRNIFDDKQYSQENVSNPNSWVEAGVTINY